MAKYVHTQVRVTIPDDPNCACRFSRCDRGSPYCEVSRLAERAVVSSKSEGEPGLSESDALLKAFDQMAQWKRQEVREEFQAFDVERKQAKRKRRTAAEMQQFRADKARQIATSYRELVPEGHFLEAPDEAMDALLTEMRRESDT